MIYTYILTQGSLSLTITEVKGTYTYTYSLVQLSVTRIRVPVDESQHMKYFQEKNEIFSPLHADVFVGWSEWGQGVPPVPDQLVL